MIEMLVTYWVTRTIENTDRTIDSTNSFANCLILTKYSHSSHNLYTLNFYNKNKLGDIQIV